MARTKAVTALARGGLLLACGAALACGSDSLDAMTSSEAPKAGGSWGDSPNQEAGGESGGQGASPLPPEQEVEQSYVSPVATGRFVWIANPKSGRVAYIDATTLAVRTVEAGNEPTYLAPVADPGGGDAAIVLNVASRDATLLRARGSDLATATFAVPGGGNTWASSASGRWAIAWTDARRVKSATRADGFQDLTVLDLTGQVAPVVLAVGYRPVVVGFTGNDTRAFAVTEDGLSLVDLTGASPRVDRQVSLDPGGVAVAPRDVSVTPDGSLALVRREGQPTVDVVTLATGTRTTVTLPAAVTDLDLSASGDTAVAVLRDTASVAVLPLPGIVQSPTSFTTVAITGETIGSVALTRQGDVGVLYTNATPVERVTLLHLASPPTFRTVRLYSPVLGVFPAENASHAVVLHQIASTTASSAVQGAFSLVPMAEDLPAKIVSTQAPPQAVAVTAGGDRGVVTERDDRRKIFGAYLARMPELAVQRFELASPPLAAGVVEGARRAYVAQEHPEGRITFLDLDGGQARTLTGFELNARVVDGSTP